MFPWQNKPPKSKPKVTYSRKRALNSPHPVSESSGSIIAHKPSEDDEMVPHSRTDASSPPPIGNTTAAGGTTEDNSMAEDSAVREDDPSMIEDGSPAPISSEGEEVEDPQQGHRVSPVAELSMTNGPDDASDDATKEYQVEYFMADDYRMFPRTNKPQQALLTKWLGFELAEDLTWEPEAQMRQDVPEFVEAYYEQKIGKSSRGRPRGLGKAPRGRPPKCSKRTRGRPRIHS